jgi:hypothetical protein
MFGRPNFRTNMKYITTKNEEGEIEMFIFPESVNHAIMAEAVARMRNQMHGDWRRITREPVSAGFVCDGFCCGRSESLGLDPAPHDTDLLRQVLPNTKLSDAPRSE